jgi:mono/diheme cytochrome c family protein
MKSTLKWAGLILGSVTILLILGMSGLYGTGRSRLYKTYDVSVQPVFIPSDPGSLTEGKRIFQYRGCEACHGEQLQGLVYMDNPALGKVITPNLTTGKGGIGSLRSDLDLVRSIKHGVRPDGTPLLFMPSTEFYFLNDADLGKVIAYIRSKPPVDKENPASTLSATGFMAMNIVKSITFLPAELIPHDQAPPTVPEPAVTAEYGEYLSLSCKVCHGLTLSGGEIPGFPTEWPATPNLTPGLGSRLPMWGESGFIDILRDGEKHGLHLSPLYMPWKSYRHMTDDELRAVYLYLMSQPPKEFGNR